jgi:hypothetical protein
MLTCVLTAIRMPRLYWPGQRRYVDIKKATVIFVSLMGAKLCTSGIGLFRKVPFRSRVVVPLFILMRPPFEGSQDALRAAQRLLSGHG